MLNQRVIIKNKALVIFCLLSFVLIYSCKESTSPQTTTFSGTVTLADTNDYSGVEVMLFKPVEIDTALLNLNKNYPGVGIELTQKTEFYWREQEPVYTTTTDAQGQWQIKKVEVGTYHIVYKKDGYGWRVQYDADGKDAYNISLERAIIWQGTYNEAGTVPQNSFVNVVGNTVFNDALTLSAGTIVEFKNKENVPPQEKIKITVKGNLTINGSAELPVYVLADDSSNYNTMEVDNAAMAQVTHCIARFVYNPFYFKNVPLVRVQQSRFDKDKIGLVINNSDSALVKNNFITRMGIDGLQTFDTHLNLRQNIFYDCYNIGFNSKKAKNSTVRFNIYYACSNCGVGMNMGGYAYANSRLIMINNDLKNNNIHVVYGKCGVLRANENNFLKVKKYFVWTNGSNNMDTLNFRQNYWNSLNIIEIYRKIYDKNDRLGQEYEWPVVDIKNYKLEKINWIKSIE